MKNTDPEIAAIKKAIRAFDLQGCKHLATWLSEHISLMEINSHRTDKNIKELGLSHRSYNVLTSYGIHSIDQLLAMDWDDVKMLKGAGNVVVEEIRKKIADCNIVTHSR